MRIFVQRVNLNLLQEGCGSFVVLLLPPGVSILNARALTARLGELAARAASSTYEVIGWRQLVNGMAQAGLSNSSPAKIIPGVKVGIAYVILAPAKLPASAAFLAAERNAGVFSVAVVFARTPKYPGGLYWVCIILFRELPKVLPAGRG